MCDLCAQECLVLMSAMELMIDQPDAWEGGHPVRNAVHQSARRACPLSSLSAWEFSLMFLSTSAPLAQNGFVPLL